MSVNFTKMFNLSNKYILINYDIIESVKQVFIEFYVYYLKRNNIARLLKTDERIRVYSIDIQKCLFIRTYN